MKPIPEIVNITAAALLLVLLAQTAAASQTYYRWVDASGTQVSSDRPPPAGVKYEVMKTETNTRVSEDALDSDSSGGGATATPVAATGGSLPRIVQEKSPEACDIARQNLEYLRTHARARMIEADGEVRFLNEDEKATQRAQAEAAIKQNCD